MLLRTSYKGHINYFFISHLKINSFNSSRSKHNHKSCLPALALNLKVTHGTFSTCPLYNMFRRDSLNTPNDTKQPPHDSPRVFKCHYCSALIIVQTLFSFHPFRWNHRFNESFICAPFWPSSRPPLLSTNLPSLPHVRDAVWEIFMTWPFFPLAIKGVHSTFFPTVCLYSNRRVPCVLAHNFYL